MEIYGDSLDSILVDLYKELLAHSENVPGSRADDAGIWEVIGVKLQISKPRARLSRSENRGKAFSPLGELLWYLSKSDRVDFIEPYIKKYQEEAEGDIVFGAYGPRIFNMRDGIDQFRNVGALLRNNPDSKRAVIQIFNAEDIVTRHKEIPCTTTMQFLVRNERLHMSVTMRSNDAYMGLPHDVFCFTMLQEMMARHIGVELGEYHHYAGSMHFYDKNRTHLTEYLNEGVQKISEMPEMPKIDPIELIENLLHAENDIRKGVKIIANETIETDYWADMVRLIQAFWAFKEKDAKRLETLKSEFAHPIYKVYLENLVSR